MSDPYALVCLLRGPTLRTRVGLWLMPLPLIGQESNEAARLNIDAVDLAEMLLGSLPENAHFAGITCDRVLELFDEICLRPQGSDCVMVYNFDLLMARLKHEKRPVVWQSLYDGFIHKTRGLVVVMPAGAEHLLPSPGQIEHWRQEERLIENEH